VHAPDLLLLDEPFTGLDLDAATTLSAMLRQAHTRGATLLMTTHDPARGFEICTHAVILARGRLVWSGSIAESQRAEFERAYRAAARAAPTQAA